jgi:hypothetical protein
MNVKTSLIVGLVLLSAIPLRAGDKNKRDLQRGMLEKMEAVPCGAKQKGLSGLGSFWGSAGITHMNSDEKLCPQYLLRTDQMDYQIRPTNLKHAVLLPVGQEGEFVIKNNQMLLSAPEGGIRKEHTYEIVSMTPTNTDASGPSHDEGEKSSSVRPDEH